MRECVGGPGGGCSCADVGNGKLYPGDSAAIGGCDGDNGGSGGSGDGCCAAWKLSRVVETGALRD